MTHPRLQAYWGSPQTPRDMLDLVHVLAEWCERSDVVPHNIHLFRAGRPRDDPPRCRRKARVVAGGEGRPRRGHVGRARSGRYRGGCGAQTRVVDPANVARAAPRRPLRQVLQDRGVRQKKKPDQKHRFWTGSSCILRPMSPRVSCELQGVADLASVLVACRARVPADFYSIF